MLQDLRFAARRLASRPAFTGLMILILALGIGANTAVFTIVDQTFLRPAAFANAERLVNVISWGPRGGGPTLTPAGILEWQSHPEVFERFEGHASRTFDISGNGEPERIAGFAVTSGLLEMLAVSPILGRSFAPDDGGSGSELVVLIGEGLWRRRFGADTGIIETVMMLSDQPHRIIGVMPRRFHLASTGTDAVWVPVDIRRPPAGAGTFMGMAKLRPGHTIGVVQERANTAAGLFQQVMSASGHRGVRLTPHTGSGVDNEARRALLILLGAVALVLLIACANVANLFLVHAAGRSREMALRSALGASRGRLVREVLAESLLLAMAGGFVSTVLALWGVDAARAAAPASMSFLASPNVEIDQRVLAFTALITLATAVLFGLLPAWRGSRPDVAAALRGVARGSLTSAGVGRLPAGLVIAEVALALTLLVGAALMGRTFTNLNAIEPGFDTRGVISAQIALPSDRYPSPSARNAFFRQLTANLSGHGGISAASFALGSAVSGFGFSWGIGAEGSDASGDDSITVGQNTVDAHYFETLGIPLVAGRTFGEGDQNVIVISRSIADQFWPDGPAIGRRLRTSTTGPWYTVIGVSGDVQAQIDAGTRWNPKMIYFPFAEGAAAGTPPPGRRTYAARMVIVRTQDVTSGTAAIKAQVWGLDASLPVERITLADDQYAAVFDRETFVLLLMTVFSAIALTLAAAGIFAVLSQVVGQRTREIGVRVALGATPRDIFRMIISRGMVLAAIGTVVGIAAAAGLSRVLTALLFEVSPYDPVSYGSVAVILMIVAFVACWLPTRRAMRIEPAVALRVE